MSEFIDSPMLGKSQIPTDEERKHVADLVELMSVCVFQELATRFNARGFMLSIVSKDEVQ